MTIAAATDPGATPVIGRVRQKICLRFLQSFQIYRFWVVFFLVCGKVDIVNKLWKEQRIMLIDPATGMGSLLGIASLKAHELQTVLLANSLHKDLKTLSLEQVLAKRLPASDPAQNKTAADDMQRAVDEFYEGVDTKVTEDWMVTQLNSALTGRSFNEQGQWLVNLLRCSEKLKPDTLQDNSRWCELQDAETFDGQDVTDLMNMARACLNENAGFMARHEFRVMEQILGQLPYEVVSAQINSGADYAVAYAAAMYIQSQQVSQDSSDTPQPTAYELGLLAANSVESSHLLAQYHFGRVRLEEAMPRLLDQAKRVLTLAGKALLQILAFGVRLEIGRLTGYSTMAIMIHFGVASTTALWVVPLLVATLTVLSFSQEEVVQEITNVWNLAKSLLNRVVSFFKNDTEAAEETVQNEEVPISMEAPDVRSSDNIITV